jgi:hypothetical protein
VFNHVPAREDLVFDRADELDRLMVAAVRERARAAARRRGVHLDAPVRACETRRTQTAVRWRPPASEGAT